MAQSKPQTYSNHRRFVPLFHFFALPILGVLLPLYSAVHIVRHPGLRSLVLLATAFALAALALSTRFFALAVQDRVILLEEKLRYEKLLSPDLQALAAKLSDDQRIGLRFASDGELAELLRKAANENLSRDQIKQAVQQWRADNRRA
jgi:hypothetical protein